MKANMLKNKALASSTDPNSISKVHINHRKFLEKKLWEWSASNWV